MVYREDDDLFQQEDCEHLTPESDGGLDGSSSPESDIELDARTRRVAEPEAFCLCYGKETTSMIKCDGCIGWYHYSCVALSSTDPPKIAVYYCPTCYRAGTGQTIWHGGAVFSKHQNRRVHEELLRQTTCGKISGVLDSHSRSQDGRLPPAAPCHRYEQNREFYVTQVEGGGFATLEGESIVIDPPHNAPPPSSAATLIYPTPAVRDMRQNLQARSANAPAQPHLALRRRATPARLPPQLLGPVGIIKPDPKGRPLSSSARSRSKPLANPLRPFSSGHMPLPKRVLLPASRSILNRDSAAVSIGNAAPCNLLNDQEGGGRICNKREKDFMNGEESLIVKLQMSKKAGHDTNKGVREGMNSPRGLYCMNVDDA